MFVLDLRQLPPVPDTISNDDGRYCFQSPLWQQVFMHHHHLTMNYRSTNDALLSEFTEQCFQGKITKEYVEFAQQLYRPLQPDIIAEATHLFGTNYECIAHNCKRLAALDGAAVTFTAKDEGVITATDQKRVPKKIALKVSVCSKLIINSIKYALYKLILRKFQTLPI